VLTTPEIQHLLTLVTYRPGWNFRAWDDRWEGQQVTIQMDLPDAYNPGQTTAIGVDSPLPPMQDSQQLYSWLAWRLGRIENHEMREYLRINGELYSNPHE
jgi:hypothetical protein